MLYISIAKLHLFLDHHPLYHILYRLGRKFLQPLKPVVGPALRMGVDHYVTGESAMADGLDDVIGTSIAPSTLAPLFLKPRYLVANAHPIAVPAPSRIGQIHHFGEIGVKIGFHFDMGLPCIAMVFTGTKALIFSKLSQKSR